MQNLEEKFELLFQNKLSDKDARELLVSLYKKGDSSEDIATAAKIMRKYSIKLDMSDELREKLIDIVGTGGDKSGSFNISTTTALLLSSVGCYVAKHGNRSITSKSGSADVLEELGVNLNLTPKEQVKMLEEVGFCFMFAQNHHPAMKHIMQIRKSIPHRTIFNILGPLTSPAQAKKYLLGVYDFNMIPKMVDALVELGVKDSMVVSSYDGVDEITLSSLTYYSHIINKNIRNGLIDPTKYGFEESELENVLGGDAKVNAAITKNILKGDEKGAKRDVVLLNGAMALMVERGMSPKEAVSLLRESISSGKAWAHFEKIKEVSNR